MRKRDSTVVSGRRISKLAVASTVAGALSIAAWALFPANRLLHLALVYGPRAVVVGYAALVLGPAAVLLAVSACVTVRPASGLGGRRWAVAGLVLGCVGFVFNPACGRLRQASRAARENKCMSNLKQTGQAFALYSNDYDGRLPKGTEHYVEQLAKPRDH